MENSTAISVQWGPVEPCADQNGPITGYSVRYGEMGSGSTQNKTVSGYLRMTTISELTKETVYTVDVAAETTAGTGVYSLPLTIQTPDSEFFPFLHICVYQIIADVYLSLNGTIIPNHGYVAINDIGSDDESALLCHTDRRPTQPSGHSGGNWFAPDETKVGGSTNVLGFTRNRGPMVVRLKRTTGSPTVGIYSCSILESGSEGQVKRVQVGLYSTTVEGTITEYLCQRTHFSYIL